MVGSILDKLHAATKKVEQSYYRLILLVGESGAGKTGALRSIADQMDTKVTSLNRELSERLLGLTAKQREAQLISITNEILKNNLSPLILDNIELLFDRTLHNDPLTVLKNLSRSRTIIASWSGTIYEGQLTYAVPSHSEFREYSLSDICVIEMNEHD